MATVEQKIFEVEGEIRALKQQLEAAGGDRDLLTALHQQLAALRQEKVLLMQQQAGAAAVATLLCCAVTRPVTAFWHHLLQHPCTHNNTFCLCHKLRTERGAAILCCAGHAASSELWPCTVVVKTARQPSTTLICVSEAMLRNLCCCCACCPACVLCSTPWLCLLHT